MRSKKPQAKNLITKNSPILVVGFGSIGQRHYRNLLSLGYVNVFVYDVDRSKLTSLGEKTIESLNLKVLSGFTSVLVCNPSHLHVETALLAIMAGCNVFIEKPLAFSDKGIAALEQAAKKHKTTVMVACNYRFHAAYASLFKILKEKRLGKALFANAEIRYDMRTARKGVDYRKSYASKAGQSGGVIYDSGSHVVDYLVDLFGVPTSVNAYTKNIVLETGLNDLAALELEFKGGIFSKIFLDLFSRTRRNFLEIECEQGTIRWDLFANSLTWSGVNKKQHTQYFYSNYADAEGRNQSYLAELKYFFETCNGKKPPIAALSHARTVTRVLERLVTSAQKGKRILI